MRKTEGHFVVRHPVTGRQVRIKGTKVEFKEFVMDITGTDELKVLSFGVNPGNALLWPMLANESATYDSFALQRVKATTITETTTTVTGRVGLAFDLEVTDPTPTTKREFMDLRKARGTAFWRNDECVMDVPAATRANSYYVAGSQAVGLDPRVTTPGKLLVMTQDCRIADVAYTGKVCELYVEYAVVLFNQNLLNAVYGNPLRVLVTDEKTTAGLVAGMILPASRQTGSNGNIGVVRGDDTRVNTASTQFAVLLPYTGNSDSTVVPTAGVYFVTLSGINAGATTANTVAATLSSSVTLRNLCGAAGAVDTESKTTGNWVAIAEVNGFGDTVPFISFAVTFGAAENWTYELTVTPWTASLNGYVTVATNDGKTVTSTDYLVGNCVGGGIVQTRDSTAELAPAPTDPSALFAAALQGPFDTAEVRRPPPLPRFADVKNSAAAPRALPAAPGTDQKAPPIDFPPDYAYFSPSKGIVVRSAVAPLGRHGATDWVLVAPNLPTDPTTRKAYNASG
jgi:hypothetical protein